MGPDESKVATRQRLRDLVSRLSDDELGRTVADGWTVAATFAHIAFWDRITHARWRAVLGRLPLPDSAFPPGSVDWTNEAAAPQWSALPPRAAAEDAVRAAEDLDRFIADLPEDARQQAMTHDRPGMLDRTFHRGPHLDRIEEVVSRPPSATAGVPVRLGPWFLVSSRLEEMGRFYREIVGLPVAREQPGHHVWFSLGAIELAVHVPEPEPGPDFTPSERGILMWFESARPLDEVAAQLRERDAPVWGPFEGGSRDLLYTLDPEGNMVGMFRSRA